MEHRIKQALEDVLDMFQLGNVSDAIMIQRLVKAGMTEDEARKHIAYIKDNWRAS